MSSARVGTKEVTPIHLEGVQRNWTHSRATHTQEHSTSGTCTCTCNMKVWYGIGSSKLKSKVTIEAGGIGRPWAVWPYHHITFMYIVQEC